MRKTENHGKIKIHTLGREISERKLKKGGKFKISTVGTMDNNKKN